MPVLHLNFISFWYYTAHVSLDNKEPEKLLFATVFKKNHLQFGKLCHIFTLLDNHSFSSLKINYVRYHNTDDVYSTNYFTDHSKIGFLMKSTAVLAFPI